jgi:hypothetical protein
LITNQAGRYGAETPLAAAMHSLKAPIPRGESAACLNCVLSAKPPPNRESPMPLLDFIDRIDRLITNRETVPVLREQIALLRDQCAAVALRAEDAERRAADAAQRAALLENQKSALEAENLRLKQQVRHLQQQLTQRPDPENPKGYACDHCGSQKIRRTGNRPDPTFGALGAKQEVFTCIACGGESAFTPE